MFETLKRDHEVSIFNSFILVTYSANVKLCKHIIQDIIKVSWIR